MKSKRKAQAKYVFPKSTPDGRGLYLISDLHRDFSALLYLDLATLDVERYVVDGGEIAEALGQFFDVDGGAGSARGITQHAATPACGPAR